MKLGVGVGRRQKWKIFEIWKFLSIFNFNAKIWIQLSQNQNRPY